MLLILLVFCVCCPSVSSRKIGYLIDYSPEREKREACAEAPLANLVTGTLLFWDRNGN